MTQLQLVKTSPIGTCAFVKGGKAFLNSSVSSRKALHEIKIERRTVNISTNLQEAE